MAAANVNVTVKELLPLGGATNDGFKLGFIDSAAKAAQNDTWTLVNVNSVHMIVPIDDSDGLLAIATIAANVVTLTSASTGGCSALVVYK